MEYPIKCFLIDDDEDEWQIFSMALEDLDPGIELQCAASASKAIVKLKSIIEDYMPDCIFIDLNMPLFEGLECLEEIKRIDRFSNVPVFLYATSADPKIVQKTKMLGAADYIVKPANICHLTETLRMILSNVQQLAVV